MGDISTPIVQFNDVSFNYKSDEPLALSDVSFSIPKGKWTSIVGHNGSGKSTIAKLMVGIEKATSGEVLYDGQVVNENLLTEVRQNVGIVFQNPENQFVGATVEFDVAFGLENQGISHAEMHQVVPQSLAEVDMTDYAQNEPQSLSGGQKQRVAIAGVLALNAQVIVLDEATSMLDPEGRQYLNQLIRQVNAEKEVTIISITHDLSKAMEADHLIVLDKGTVFHSGSPEEIFNQGSALKDIGLDLPFSMRIHELLGYPLEYVTYQGLVDKL